MLLLDFGTKKKYIYITFHEHNARSESSAQNLGKRETKIWNGKLRHLEFVGRKIERYKYMKQKSEPSKYT